MREEVQCTQSVVREVHSFVPKADGDLFHKATEIPKDDALILRLLGSLLRPAPRHDHLGVLARSEAVFRKLLDDAALTELALDKISQRPALTRLLYTNLERILAKRLRC